MMVVHTKTPKRRTKSGAFSFPGASEAALNTPVCNNLRDRTRQRRRTASI